MHFFVGEISHETQNEACTTEPARDSNSRPHVRADCDKEFATECALKRHGETHSDKMYSCTECKKCFSAQRYLRQHMNIHNSRYKCSECGKCFRDRRLLTVHRRSHSGDKPFECSVCGKRFSQDGTLTTHSKIHTGERLLKCHYCGKAFSLSARLISHMKVHTGDKPHKCSACDKCFSWPSNLQKHKRRMHSHARPLTCSYCGKLFQTVSDVKRHIVDHHRPTHADRSDEKLFMCGKCGREFMHMSDASCHFGRCSVTVDNALFSLQVSDWMVGRVVHVTLSRFHHLRRYLLVANVEWKKLLWS